MAYFAKLGKGNVVEQVVVVSNDIATTEQAGIDFLNDLYKTRDVWKQTYIDGSQRKNYATVDGIYDQTRDAFIAPQTYKGWILNETTCEWEAPVVKPDDNNRYIWNEDTQQWDLENE